MAYAIPTPIHAHATPDTVVKSVPLAHVVTLLRSVTATVSATPHRVRATM
jgi:hypothetical protein